MTDQEEKTLREDAYNSYITKLSSFTDDDYIQKVIDLGFVFKDTNDFNRFKEGVKKIFLNKSGEARRSMYEGLAWVSFDVEYFNALDLFMSLTNATSFLYGDLHSLNFSYSKDNQYLEVKLYSERLRKGVLQTFSTPIDQNYTPEFLIFLNSIAEKAPYFIDGADKGARFIDLPIFDGQHVPIAIVKPSNYELAIEMGIIPSQYAIEHITGEW
jgi:hypothetical protein